MFGEETGRDIDSSTNVTYLFRLFAVSFKSFKKANIIAYFIAKIISQWLLLRTVPTDSTVFLHVL